MNDLATISVHEAGHCAAHFSFKHSVLEVQIGNAKGFTSAPIDIDRATVDEVLDHATCAMAGAAAVELILLGADPHWGSDADYDLCLNLCRRATDNVGLVTQLYAQARGRANALVKKHQAAIERIAAALLDRGELTGRQAHELFRGPGVPAQTRQAARLRRAVWWRGY